MNLRVFKKDIEFFIGEFIEDCELFVILNPHKDAEKIDEIVEEAVDLYNDQAEGRSSGGKQEGILHRPHQGNVREARRALREAERSGFRRSIILECLPETERPDLEVGFGRFFCYFCGRMKDMRHIANIFSVLLTVLTAASGEVFGQDLGTGGLQVEQYLEK